MEYRKNDIVTLEIVDCGTDGEGIGKADGFTVFVKERSHWRYCYSQNYEG